MSGFEQLKICVMVPNSAMRRLLRAFGDGRGSVRRAVWGSIFVGLAAAGTGVVLAPSESETRSSPLVEQKLELALTTIPETGSESWRKIRPFPTEYQILFKRSIFSRVPISADRDGLALARPTRIEVDFVLRGVASQGGVLTAFVENAPQGRMLRLRPGDRLARGKLGAVSFSGVNYECNGAVTRVPLGCAFDGTRQEPVPVASTQPDSESGETPRHVSRRLKSAGESQPIERPRSSSDAPNEKAR